MNFHIVYTDGGSITLKSFETKKERLAWVGEFTLAHLGHEDYSVDMTFDGQIGVVNPYIVVNE